MKVVTIGRDPGNDVVINDAKVSRRHLKLIKSDSGDIKVVDTSTNGTWVNGKKIHHAEYYIYRGDSIRIGDTRLPWLSYFEQTMRHCPDSVPEDHPVLQPRQSYHGPFNSKESSSSSNKTGLGIVALVLSIIGGGCVVVAAIKLLRWGALAFIGNTTTLLLLSIAANVLAMILAWIAESADYKDEDVGRIAKGIAGFFIMVVIGFYIVLKINPDLLNPFRNISF